MAPITTIPNLGPATEKAFAKAGILAAEELRDLGAREAYRMLLKSGTRPHFISYYVLVMGLQDRPWNDCPGEEKKQLRAEFDAIKSESFDNQQSEMDAFMNEMGILPAPIDGKAR